MTTENETPESATEEQKSFFARGALLGLVGGAVIALLLISVAGSVVSLPSLPDAPVLRVAPWV